jgi:hypothetical protein
MRFYLKYNLDGTYQEEEVYNDASLVHYTQRQIANNINASSGLKNNLDFNLNNILLII